MRSYIAASLAFFIMGCANTHTSWRESVASSDQQVIVLDRVETRWAHASVALPGSGFPESQYLSASIPKLGDVVWREESGLSQPIGFDVVNGVPWLIQDNDSPCERNPTPESMRIFRHIGGKWEQVRMADAPKQLRGNLTRYRSPKSHGNLGVRPYYGNCDANRPKDYAAIDNREAFSYLEFNRNCGQTLEDLQDSLLSTRNCALAGPPISPSFAAKWDAYQREKIKNIKATVVEKNASPPALPTIASGDKNRFYVPGAIFKCTIGCRKSELSQVATYAPIGYEKKSGYSTSSGNSLYEFLLAGPDKKKFYANVERHNSLLWCDMQGYKILKFSESSNKSMEVQATVFDRNGDLVGKWNVEFPTKAVSPELYRTENNWTFMRGFDVENNGSLRLLIGQTQKPVEACGLSDHYLVNNKVNVIALRAPKN